MKKPLSPLEQILMEELLGAIAEGEKPVVDESENSLLLLEEINIIVN